MAKIPIEQLIDIVQDELTFSRALPKVLPDREIKRLIKEKALEYFFKNYQFAVTKTYFLLHRDRLTHEQATGEQYIEMPEEVESIINIKNINDPSLFRIGIQAPNLSINFGVTNQPYLTSFVTNVGDLATYRQILSYFSDEVNKLAQNFTKFHYNHVDKRLHLLDDMRNNLMLEVYIRIEQESLFDHQLFKDYITGLAKKRMGEMLGQFTFNMPGNFQYNANDIITQGSELVEKVETQIKEESKVTWFYMSK